MIVLSKTYNIALSCTGGINLGLARQLQQPARDDAYKAALLWLLYRFHIVEDLSL